jgi:3-oxoacyl-(acyl-carrier-protein) synthase
MKWFSDFKGDMSKSKRIVITGVGPITAIGIGKDHLWDSIRNKRSNVILEDHYLDEEYWGSFHIAKVFDFDIGNFGLSSGTVASLRRRESDNSRDLLYLLAASKLALDDSRLSYDRDDNNLGLILTCENPGLDDLICRIIDSTLGVIEGRAPATPLKTKRDFIQTMYEQFEKRVYNLQSFMYLHYVSNALGLHGTPLFINNACASGLFALESAAQQIQCGGTDVVIVAGGDNPSFMTKYLWFKGLGIYAEDGLMKPFDKGRHGIVFGDGAAAIVLEDMEHALNRGAHIYGEYLGGGFNQDAWKVTVPSVTTNYYSKAFKQALKNSDLRPEDIDLLNPHGACTGIGDKYEALTIQEIFKGSARRPMISAFKPYIGHNLGGSALTELIILLMSMKNNYVPATLNHTEPDPELNIALAPETNSADIRTVAKMSTGFGGYNAVALFRKLD